MANPIPTISLFDDDGGASDDFFSSLSASSVETAPKEQSTDFFDSLASDEPKKEEFTISSNLADKPDSPPPVEEETQNTQQEDSFKHIDPIISETEELKEEDLPQEIPEEEIAQVSTSPTSKNEEEESEAIPPEDFSKEDSTNEVPSQEESPKEQAPNQDAVPDISTEEKDDSQQNSSKIETSKETPKENDGPKEAESLFFGDDDEDEASSFFKTISSTSLSSMDKSDTFAQHSRSASLPSFEPSHNVPKPEAPSPAPSTPVSVPPPTFTPTPPPRTSNSPPPPSTSSFPSSSSIPSHLSSLSSSSPSLPTAPSSSPLPRHKPPPSFVPFVPPPISQPRSQNPLSMSQDSQPTSHFRQKSKEYSIPPFVPPPSVFTPQPPPSQGPPTTQAPPSRSRVPSHPPTSAQPSHLPSFPPPTSVPSFSPPSQSSQTTKEPPPPSQSSHTAPSIYDPTKRTPSRPPSFQSFGPPPSFTPFVPKGAQDSQGPSDQVAFDLNVPSKPSTFSQPSHTPSPTPYNPSTPFQGPLPPSHGTPAPIQAFHPKLSYPQKEDREFRPPHPLGVFTASGKFISIFPRKRTRLNSFAAQQSQGEEGLLPGFLRIDSMSKLIGQSDYFSNLKSFPGPLTSSSSKDPVIQYVTQRGKDASPDEFLLWELLGILCRHYGNVSEAFGDIRSLLLTHQTTMPSTPEDPQAVETLQSLLIEGKSKEAYEFAVRSHLWSHALLLSSNLSIETFKETVQLFSTASLVEGSPLRTLYNLFSGKFQDLFPRGAGIEWRGNLAAIMAQGVKGVKAVGGSLGDSLWANQRNVFAAHFCYVVMEHDLGYFNDRNTRLVLVGGDHKTRLISFASQDAEQRTEVVEYFRLLENSQTVLPSLQPFKLHYAFRLLEVGLVDQAKKYHHVINSTVSKNKGHAYSPTFLLHLQVLGDLLSPQKNDTSGSWALPTLNIGNFFGKIIGSSDKRNSAPPQLGTPAPMAPTPSPMVPASGPSHPQERKVADSPRRESTDNSSPTPSPREETDSQNSNNRGSWGGGFAMKLSGILSPMFARAQGKVVADLGEENSFEYSKELGRWIRKGEDVSAASSAPPLGPPPMGNPSSPMRNSAPPMGSSGPPMGTSAAPMGTSTPPMGSSGPPPMGSGPPPNGSVSAPTSPMPPMRSNRFSSPRDRNVRSRYVDTLNPGSVSAPTTPAPLPTKPDHSEFKVFTPKATEGNESSFVPPSFPPPPEEVPQEESTDQ